MTMVEIIAKSLEAEFISTIEKSSGIAFKDSGVQLPRRDVWERYAKAALKAMREPTKEMAARGADAFFSPMPATTADENARAASVWRRSIDAALKESE